MIIDHGRGIVNVRAKSFIPIPVVFIVFVGLISKREDKLIGVNGVLCSKLR